ncbi:MAG: hypothetical protein OXG15_06545 [Gammaproteobacteria bacterium]|nr:hypothetical protein [Gammaproteobacteria bacterium]
MLSSISQSELDDAGWAFDQRAPFKASNVASLIPQIFESYARIFHPATQVWRADQVHDKTWADIARICGRRAHGLMQWKSIYDPGKLLFTVNQPIEGTIPYQVSQPLRRLLTSTGDERCYLATWVGYGTDYRSYVPPTLRIDTGAQREYDLFVGPVTMLDIPFLQYSLQTANVIWAHDRTWWITNDIDLDTTYIGGSKKLVEGLLASDDLEVWPAELEDEIWEGSDKVNVLPE